jgi:hypothetical protein
MSQSQIVLNILYRTEKSALSMIKKAFEGQPLEPQIQAVVERKRANVAELEKQLAKRKGTS